MDLEIPVYVPTREGLNPEINMGMGHLTDGELHIKFDKSLPATAIQRMLARGENLGLTFVIQKKKEEIDE